jgi:hypothetical protein
LVVCPESSDGLVVFEGGLELCDAIGDTLHILDDSEVY